MSLVKIRAALEGAVAGMSPALATAYEGVAFKPTAGVPYQRLYLRPAKPNNNEISRSYIEQGFLQIDLLYPAGQGSGAATARAELIRATFFNGASFPKDGVTTRISGTPEIADAQVEGDRWRQTVRIRFRAQITG